LSQIDIDNGVAIMKAVYYRSGDKVIDTDSTSFFNPPYKINYNEDFKRGLMLGTLLVNEKGLIVKNSMATWDVKLTLAPSTTENRITITWNTSYIDYFKKITIVRATGSGVDINSISDGMVITTSTTKGMGSFDDTTVSANTDYTYKAFVECLNDNDLNVGNGSYNPYVIIKDTTVTNYNILESDKKSVQYTVTIPIDGTYKDKNLAIVQEYMNKLNSLMSKNKITCWVAASTTELDNSLWSIVENGSYEYSSLLKLINFKGNWSSNYIVGLLHLKVEDFDILITSVGGTNSVYDIDTYIHILNKNEYIESIYMVNLSSYYIHTDENITVNIVDGDVLSLIKTYRPNDPTAHNNYAGVDGTNDVQYEVYINDIITNMP
jgi:hypothetical protein